MGLNISAYRGLKMAIGNGKAEDGEIDYDRYFHAWGVDCTESACPGRAGSIVQDAIYEYKERIDFRAGSYTYYLGFRDWLAQLAGYKSLVEYWMNDNPNADFYELINFSDCEGVIGSVAAGELLNDFQKHTATVNQMTAQCDYPETFVAWKRACELAADNGAISLH
jgi:hypothetical protein